MTIIHVVLGTLSLDYLVDKFHEYYRDQLIEGEKVDIESAK